MAFRRVFCSPAVLAGAVSTAAGWILFRKDGIDTSTAGGNQSQRRLLQNGLVQQVVLGPAQLQASVCDSKSSSSLSAQSSETLAEHLAFLESPGDSPMRRAVIELVGRMQLEIRDHVNFLERVRGAAGQPSTTVLVDRDDRRTQGKRGIAMAIQGGQVFEKGGFSVTVMSKNLSSGMAKQMSSNHAGLRKRLQEAKDDDAHAQEPFKMWVCGLSLILHPRHPLGATVHLNYRYFEVLRGDEVVAWWFGGGNDLTPIYVDEEEAVHFHQTLKDVCDRHNPE